MLRSFVVAMLTVLWVVTVSAGAASAAPPAVLGSSVSVSGAVSSPASYSIGQLSAMPQITVPSSRVSGGSVTGVSLQALVIKSAPRFDTGKNPLLRVAVTVRGVGRAVTFALGELDAGFGNHPAVFSSAGSGSLSMRTDLVVPGDRSSARSVFGVYRVEVAVTPSGPVPAAVGGVDVIYRGRTAALSNAALARLPQRSQTVSFTASGVTTSRTFVGPDLGAALRTVGVVPTVSTSVVTATGSDGYAANVTLGEAFFGGRPLLLALSENSTALSRPRLVPAGDIKGGRYITDTTSLVVSDS